MALGSLAALTPAEVVFMEKKFTPDGHARETSPAGIHDRKHGGTQGWACAEYGPKHLDVWFHRPHPSLAYTGPTLPTALRPSPPPGSLPGAPSWFQAPSPCRPFCHGQWTPGEPPTRLSPNCWLIQRMIQLETCGAFSSAASLPWTGLTAAESGPSCTGLEHRLSDSGVLSCDQLCTQSKPFSDLCLEDKATV